MFENIEAIKNIEVFSDDYKVFQNKYIQAMIIVPLVADISIFKPIGTYVPTVQ